MKFFIIIKKNSERLPHKNFLQLGNKSLFRHLLDELDGEEIFIDTDSQVIHEYYGDKDITCYMRNQKFIDLETSRNFKVSPVLMMVENFLDKYVDDENEIIVTPHVTSPYIMLNTIKEASKKLDEGYDSVQACTEHQEFTYFKGKPVNFDPDVVQKTQDLEPVIMGNGAFFIFTKKTFKENNNRVGKNPYFYPITFPESVEIDNRIDWEITKRIYEKSN